MININNTQAMDKEAIDFKNNGFAHFKSVLSAEEISIFRREIARIIKEKPNQELGETSYARGNILMRSEIITKLFLQEKVLDTIKKICGESFFVLPEISVMKSQYGGWHKDTTSVELFGYDFHKKEEFKVVNVAIYCQDNGEFGGGLDVVPGSHKKEDIYVDFHREKKENMMMTGGAPHQNAKSVSLLTQVKESAKKVIKTILLKSGLLPAYYVQRHYAANFPFPLDSNDTKQDRIHVPSKIGDIVIFDLRLDHKASWPQKPFNPELAPLKYVFFARCGANNTATKEYRDYLFKRSETDLAYYCLKDYSIPALANELSKKNNVTIL